MPCGSLFLLDFALKSFHPTMSVECGPWLNCATHYCVRRTFIDFLRGNDCKFPVERCFFFQRSRSDHFVDLSFPLVVPVFLVHSRRNFVSILFFSSSTTTKATRGTVSRCRLSGRLFPFFFIFVPTKKKRNDSGEESELRKKNKLSGK